MGDQATLKCAKCDVPLQSDVIGPKDDDILSCPTCGQADTFKNVMVEIGDYVAEQAGSYVFDGFVQGARGSKNLTVTRKPGPKKIHRFKIDFDLHD